MKKTKDNQYSYMFEMVDNHEVEDLGLVANSSWKRDPKRLVFSMSRYKFVAKMFADFENVLEIGCGDAWLSRIVAQGVKNLTVSDYDPLFIDYAISKQSTRWKMTYEVLNLLDSPSQKKYDGIYLLDVLEHISLSEENIFLANLCKSLSKNGCAIIGIPSLISQSFIAPEKRDPGHINCKNGKDFKNTLSKYFDKVFLFSMNDEIVHTGGNDLVYYHLAMCCYPNLTQR